MRFEIEKIKVSMHPENINFEYNDRTVTCKIHWFVRMPNKYWPALGPIFGCVKGTATCHPEDTYNPEIGKKVALAKAEAKAYKQAQKIIIMKLKKMTDLYLGIIEMADEFDERAEHAVQHNKEFIDKITSNA